MSRLRITATNSRPLRLLRFLCCLIGILGCQVSAQDLDPISASVLEATDGLNFVGVLEEARCGDGLAPNAREVLLKDAWRLLRGSLQIRFDDGPAATHLSMSSMRLSHCAAVLANNNFALNFSDHPLFVMTKRDIEALDIYRENDLLKLFLLDEPGLEEIAHRGHYSIQAFFSEDGSPSLVLERAQPEGFSIYRRVPNWRKNLIVPQISADWTERSLSDQELTRYSSNGDVYGLTRSFDISSLGPIILASKLATLREHASFEHAELHWTNAMIAESLLAASQYKFGLSERPSELFGPIRRGARSAQTLYLNDPADTTSAELHARMSISVPLSFFRNGRFSNAELSYRMVATDPIDEFAESAALFGIGMALVGQMEWSDACGAFHEFAMRNDGSSVEQSRLRFLEYLAARLDQLSSHAQTCQQLTELLQVAPNLKGLETLAASQLAGEIGSFSSELRWLRNGEFSIPILMTWIDLARKKNAEQAERLALRELMAYVRDLYYSVSFEWDGKWSAKDVSFADYPHNLTCPQELLGQHSGFPAEMVCLAQTYAEFTRELTSEGQVVLLPYLDSYSKSDPEEDLATTGVVYFGFSNSSEAKDWVRFSLLQNPPNVRPLLKLALIDWFVITMPELKTAGISPNDLIYRPLDAISQDELVAALDIAVNDDSSKIELALRLREFLSERYR